MAERIDSIVVTGASSGIGLATARRLQGRCGRLVLVARRAEKLAGIAETLDSSGGVVEVLPADLADAEQRRGVAARVGELSEAGRLVLVNNAGRGQYEPMLEVGEAEHRWLMELNYFAAVELMLAAAPGMRRHGWGRVVNVSSMSVVGPPWGHGAYTASKAALAAVGVIVDGENRRAGVRVSTLYPGIVATAFFEQPHAAGLWQQVRKRAIPPERIAATIERLIDRPRVQATVPRHYRMLDLIRFVSAEWAHRLVFSQSRPTPGGSATGAWQADRGEAERPIRGERAAALEGVRP
jgi:short-subunit dehydrogenase